MNILTFIRQLGYNSYPVGDVFFTKYSIELEHIALMPRVRVKRYDEQCHYTPIVLRTRIRPRNKCNLHANTDYKN